ncbi:MAG: hypothetical protein EHM45_13275 [Desulfobacteraceae bacterium]|nr:MAG: hypothetical protein EHM45_13275 [Desulfobacteraceae bacterium]
MEVIYLFSSPQGDIVLDAETLKCPFRLTPLESHPFLLLKDFFDAIKNNILRDQGRTLAQFLQGLWQQEVSIEHLDRILIRYEKYGTLYHMASLEIWAAQKRIKLAVAVAFSAEAQSGLDFEFEILKQLNDYYQLPYLPQVVFKNPVSVEKNGMTEILLMMFSQWFEGFHEWHFANPEAGEQTIVIWDQEKGHRSVSGPECREIIRQAAYILTLYYDLQEGYQIHPWHHGAGDFVVKSDGKSVEVRLITARGYEKLFQKQGEAQPDALTSLLYFLLNLTLKMRLDKAEGLGEPVWADRSIVAPVLDGFFRALKIKELQEDHPAGKTTEVAAFMKSLDQKKIETWYYLQLERYRLSEKEDYPVIRKNIEAHSADVFRALQNFQAAFLSEMKAPQ